METAMLRYDEVDAENRSLRAAKYELETKVLNPPFPSCCSYTIVTGLSCCKANADRLGCMTHVPTPHLWPRRYASMLHEWHDLACVHASCRSLSSSTGCARRMAATPWRRRS